MAVTGEGVVAFLNARAAGVVDADDGHAGFHGVFHGVANFLGVDLAERSAADRKVLGVSGHGAAINVANTSDDAVAGEHFVSHAEVRGLVLRVHAGLHKGAGREERVDAVASREQALGAARREFVRATAVEGDFAMFTESFQQCGVDCHNEKLSRLRLRVRMR